MRPDFYRRGRPWEGTSKAAALSRAEKAVFSKRYLDCLPIFPPKASEGGDFRNKTGNKD